MTDADLITQASFANLMGITRQSVRDLVLSGRLVKYDNQIDLNDPLTQAYMEKRTIGDGLLERPKTERKKAKKRTLTKVTKKAAKEEKQQQIVKKPPVREDAHDYTLDPNKPIEQLSRREIELRKIIAQTQGIEVKTETERQLLIKKELVHRVFAKMYSVDTSLLHPLGGKICADVAALYGNNDPQLKLKTRELIDDPIFEALEHIKRIMNQFLSAQNSEEI